MWSLVHVKSAVASSAFFLMDFVLFCPKRLSPARLLPCPPGTQIWSCLGCLIGRFKCNMAETEPLALLPAPCNQTCSFPVLLLLMNGNIMEPVQAQAQTRSLTPSISLDSPSVNPIGSTTHFSPLLPPTSRPPTSPGLLIPSPNPLASL